MSKNSLNQNPLIKTNHNATSNATS